MQAASVSRVPIEERLFSLVLALLATETGLTKNEILSTVQGYRQRYLLGGNNTTLERQFERDKDDIRELGVPLETWDASGEGDNNQNLRYRIPRARYEISADITFSAEETALLNLAALVWREGSLSGESRRAVMKLKSLGLTTAEPVLGYLPRLTARDGAFEPLRTAIERSTIVRFSYLKPGEATAGRREVAPLALVQHQGLWHLYAREMTAARTFLLRRIVDQVATTRATFDRQPADYADQALRELDALWNSQTAELEVVSDSDAAVRLSKRRGNSQLSSGAWLMHYTDLNIFADELASHGPEVFVLYPPQLSSAVLARLVRTAEGHAQISAQAGD